MTLITLTCGYYTDYVLCAHGTARKVRPETAYEMINLSRRRKNADV